MLSCCRQASGLGGCRASAVPKEPAARSGGSEVLPDWECWIPEKLSYRINV